MIREPIARLAALGTAETDDDETRAQKATLTLGASLITLLATVWVATYLALGLPDAAAIPFAYQVASIASLVVFRRSNSYRLFRFSQAAMMTTPAVSPPVGPRRVCRVQRGESVGARGLDRHAVLLHRR